MASSGADSLIGSAGRAVLDALLPPTCLACDEPSPEPDAFCARCAETVELAPPSSPHLAAFLFGGAVADAVRACKFRPDAARADALGRLWASRLHAAPAGIPSELHGVTFVPAHWRRRIARGFDLPAMLSRHVARAIAAPQVDLLVATRADAPLSFGADRAVRSAAVKGRYRPRSAAVVEPWRGRTVLLVDDVRTTGATLGEAAAVLRAAGIDVVEAALAVVP